METPKAGRWMADRWAPEVGPNSLGLLEPLAFHWNCSAVELRLWMGWSSPPVVVDRPRMEDVVPREVREVMKVMSCSAALAASGNERIDLGVEGIAKELLEVAMGVMKESCSPVEMVEEGRGWGSARAVETILVPREPPPA